MDTILNETKHFSVALRSGVYCNCVLLSSRMRRLCRRQTRHRPGGRELGSSQGSGRAEESAVLFPAGRGGAPTESELSPEAQCTYAYLLYVQALTDEDEDALLLAATQLKEARVPTRIWLEGGVWLMSRKSPKVLDLLEQALTVWPQDLSLNLLHAEALMEHGMPEKGVELMREYLETHPDALDARLELALLLVKSKQFQEAEKLLDTIPAKQRSPLVDYYHARALIGMQRPGEAVPYLQKAIKDLPDFVEAMAELAFIYEQRSDLREARAVYERLLKLNFSSQDVALRLINISLRLKQPEKALQYMRQAPDTLPFKITVASMFMESRHYLQAESLLKQIESEGGAPSQVYLLLADLTYEQRRDLPMALAWLDKMPPKSKNAARAGCCAPNCSPKPAE